MFGPLDGWTLKVMQSIMEMLDLGHVSLVGRMGAKSDEINYGNS